MGPELPEKVCSVCGYTNPNISHYVYIQGDRIATLVDRDFQKAMPHKEDCSNLATREMCEFVCFRCAARATGENFDHASNGGPNTKFKKLSVRCLKSMAYPKPTASAKSFPKPSTKEVVPSGGSSDPVSDPTQTPTQPNWPACK